MVSADEEDRLITNPDINVLERPQSRLWRVIHGTFYMIGGISFLCASCMYLPSVNTKYPVALDIGGWLFTIGSFFLLLADLQEWWYYRVGCCFDRKYRASLEAQNTSLFCNPPDTLLGRCARAEVGINFFISACASALYLAGSILFLPIFNSYLIAGECLFIVGSAVIIRAQIWKLYRLGCTNISDRTDHRFHFPNFVNDLPSLGIDSFKGLGGIFYFIGTVLFLPSNDTSVSVATNAAILLICGGTCFTLTSCFLQYRHHFIHHG